MRGIYRLSTLQLSPLRSISSVRRSLAIKRAPLSANKSVFPSSTATKTQPVSSETVSVAQEDNLLELSSSSPEPIKNPFPLKDSASVEGQLGPGIDWSDSFHGLGQQAFSKEAADLLLAPLATEDIEIKPDGLLYLPEIKYRRILNKAFGPGGWGLAPRTETLVTPKQVSREYALICNGRLVSVARGEQDYFGGEEKLTTALEGCKSNALMRCCKDLGIASELWDPVFIRQFKKSHCDELFAEHVVTKKKKKLWKLKVNSFEYPYKSC